MTLFPRLAALALLLIPLLTGPCRADNGIEVFNRVTKQKFLKAELQRILSDPEAAKRRYLAVAYRVAGDGHISDVAVKRRVRFSAAQRRARELAKMLSHDLDGDGAVSSEDMREMQQILTHKKAAAARARHFAYDLNADGDLTVPEMLSGLSDPPAMIGGIKNTHEITVILGMDLNGDGVTVPEEIIAAIDMLHDAAKR